MSGTGPEGIPQDPFVPPEEHAIANRVGVESNVRTYVALHRILLEPDSPDELGFDPEKIGREGPPKTFMLDKAALGQQLDEIEAALEDPSEPDGDLRIWGAMDNVSSLLRGEPITNETKGD